MNRWYIYKHKVHGGLATDLTPPEEKANLDLYEVSGPFSNKDIVNKFWEIHNAATALKAKKAINDRARTGTNVVG